MMSDEKIRAGQWLISEGQAPLETMYRLRLGKVSIYKSGVKISEVTVKNGSPPVTLGLVALFNDDNAATTSIYSETDLEVDAVPSAVVRNMVSYKVGAETRDALLAMVRAIDAVNEIKYRIRQCAGQSGVQLRIPETAGPEASRLLSEVTKLYQSSVQDARALGLCVHRGAGRCSEAEFIR